MQFHDKTLELVRNQLASSTHDHTEAVNELMVTVTNDRIDNLASKVDQIHEDLLSKVDSVEIKVFGEKATSQNGNPNSSTQENEQVNDDASVATQGTSFQVHPVKFKQKLFTAAMKTPRV